MGASQDLWLGGPLEGRRVRAKLKRLLFCFVTVLIQCRIEKGSGTWTSLTVSFPIRSFPSRTHVMMNVSLFHSNLRSKKSYSTLVTMWPKTVTLDWAMAPRPSQGGRGEFGGKKMCSGRRNMTGRWWALFLTVWSYPSNKILLDFFKEKCIILSRHTTKNTFLLYYFCHCRCIWHGRKDPPLGR